MSRDSRLYLDDIQQALDWIARYVGEPDFATFSSDDLLVDGVV
ncbi:MAG: hypothetical protein ACHQ4H_06020 [Ktedonobacterales bacterium]